MKYGKYLFALALLVLFISSAFSQEEVIMLQSKEPGVKERPVVRFTHEDHANLFECLRCHHDYDKYGNNRGGDGGSCVECHGKDSGKGLPPLTEAFHMQCKGCHEDTLAKGTGSGPIMCGECHVKN